MRLPDKHGDTALAAAAKTAQWPACAELLFLKANPNTSDEYGYPPLFYMAQAFSASSVDTPENLALAHFIRYVRLLGYHFDCAVLNPDLRTRDLSKWINVADLLVSNPGQLGLYASLIFGTSHAIAHQALSASTSTATSSTSSSTTTPPPH